MSQCRLVTVCKPKSPAEMMYRNYLEACDSSMRAREQYLREYAIWRADLIEKQKQAKKIRFERRQKYKEKEDARIKAEQEKQKELILLKEREEEEKYRLFSGRNGISIEAKILAISPYVRKAKIQDRNGQTYEIALANFSDDDLYYLRSWSP